MPKGSWIKFVQQNASVNTFRTARFETHTHRQGKPCIRSFTGFTTKQQHLDILKTMGASHVGVAPFQTFPPQRLKESTFQEAAIVLFKVFHQLLWFYLKDARPKLQAGALKKEKQQTKRGFLTKTKCKDLTEMYPSCKIHTYWYVYHISNIIETLYENKKMYVSGGSSFLFLAWFPPTSVLVM